MVEKKSFGYSYRTVKIVVFGRNCCELNKHKNSCSSSCLKPLANDASGYSESLSTISEGQREVVSKAISLVKLLRLCLSSIIASFKHSAIFFFVSEVASLYSLINSTMFNVAVFNCSCNILVMVDILSDSNFLIFALTLPPFTDFLI